MLFKDPFGALASRCAHRDPDAFDLRRVVSSWRSCLDLGEATLAAVSFVCMDLSNFCSSQAVLASPQFSNTLARVGQGRKSGKEDGKGCCVFFLEVN